MVFGSFMFLYYESNTGKPLVPGAGIEPARLAAGDFESPASTNFTTRAKGDMSTKLKLEDRYYKAFRKFCFELSFSQSFSRF